MDITKLIDAYDTYFGEEPIDPSKLSDEEIDEIIWLETDMWQALDSLILAKKVYSERKTIAEKKEKLTTTLMARILKRLDKKERESEDGKVKFCASYKFDIDMAKLPEEYITSNRAKINWAISRWEKIDWVEVTDSFWYVRVY